MSYANTAISSSVSSLFGELSKEVVDKEEVTFISDLIISSNHYLTNPERFEKWVLKRIEKADIKIDNLIKVQSEFIKNQFGKLRNILDDDFFYDIFPKLFNGGFRYHLLNASAIRGIELISFFNRTEIIDFIKRVEKEGSKSLEELESMFMYLRGLVYRDIKNKQSINDILKKIARKPNLKNIETFKKSVLKNVFTEKQNKPVNTKIESYYEIYKPSEEGTIKLLLKYR